MDALANYRRLQLGNPNVDAAITPSKPSTTTDVELLGHPFPVLTNPNRQQHSRTEPIWPQADDTLALPVGIVTFSNDDLCFQSQIITRHYL